MYPTSELVGDAAREADGGTHHLQPLVERVGLRLEATAGAVPGGRAPTTITTAASRERWRIQREAQTSIFRCEWKTQNAYEHSEKKQSYMCRGQNTETRLQHILGLNHTDKSGNTRSEKISVVIKE